jgi:hypothetical protein
LTGAEIFGVVGVCLGLPATLGAILSLITTRREHEALVKRVDQLEVATDKRLDRVEAEAGSASRDLSATSRDVVRALTLLGKG